MKDGKPIIIEGMHLDPSIYLMDDENKLSTTLPAIGEEKSSKNGKIGMAVENDSSSEYGNQGKSDASRQEGRSGEIICSVDGVADDLKSVDMGSSLPDNKGETIKDSEADEAPSVKREKSGPEPIIVPIILKMADFDHKALLEEWISTCSCEKYPDKDKLISNLKTIQDYLCSFKSQELIRNSTLKNGGPASLSFTGLFIMVA